MEKVEDDGLELLVEWMCFKEFAREVEERSSSYSGFGTLSRKFASVKVKGQSERARFNPP